MLIPAASAQSAVQDPETVTNARLPEEIFLHGDTYGLESPVSKMSKDDYESFLGRTPRQSRAWTEVASANASWKQRAFANAIAAWRSTASNFSDTDAAYAALSNVALGCKELGDVHSHVEALQLLLLIPQPTLTDMGAEHHNYRHDACVALADHYESKGFDGIACRFLSQALEIDERYDTCGVYWISVVTDLKKRHSRLMESLLTKQGK
jgi:hypothetical protein